MYSAEYLYSSEYAIAMAYIDMNAVLPEVEDGSDKLLEKYLGEEERKMNVLIKYLWGKWRWG